MRSYFESGRSMVEMLGVLAIIGVLSMGGIMAYSLAMAKHKANELSQATRINIALLQTSDNQSSLTTPEETDVAGATLSFFSTVSPVEYVNAGVKIDFGEDNEDVCQQFYDLYKEHPDYKIVAKCGGIEMN